MQLGLDNSKGHMIKITNFIYEPNSSECEKASASYLMSLVTIIIGMPLPIINLIASFLFYLLNKRSTQFVRWHCIQVFISQLFLFGINSIGFSWTLSCLMGIVSFSNLYFSYLLSLLIFNLIEIISSIVSAIQTRKGKHVEWWAFNDLTNFFCRQKE